MRLQPLAGAASRLPRRAAASAAAGSSASTRTPSYYGGTDTGNLGGVDAQALGWHGQPCSAEVTLPPLGVVWLVPERAATVEEIAKADELEA